MSRRHVRRHVQVVDMNSCNDVLQVLETRLIVATARLEQVDGGLPTEGLWWRGSTSGQERWAGIKGVLRRGHRGEVCYSEAIRRRRRVASEAFTTLRNFGAVFGDGRTDAPRNGACLRRGQSVQGSFLRGLPKKRHTCS